MRLVFLSPRHTHNRGTDQSDICNIYVCIYVYIYDACNIYTYKYVYYSNMPDEWIKTERGRRGSASDERTHTYIYAYTHASSGPQGQ